ncbi:UV excision repair protein RAD23 homolog B-like isoform X3 [Frankliniella occidentalis]|uniref:UV excision repair protein RAD23 homolog B-like isoform X3 n=1 Tax=Frankliniella occidentalis TaxID=133901 RepID=A0A6J1SNP7_FRAOC|nr:UV excision repair protein RAD23 homolog B-like isoform X3 [Frankliniella occidentalis]
MRCWVLWVCFALWCGVLEQGGSVAGHLLRVQAGGLLSDDANLTSSAADTVSSSGAPGPATLAPVAATVSPVSANVSPVSATVAPVSANVSPVSATVAPVSATVAPTAPVSATAARVPLTAAPGEVSTLRRRPAEVTSHPPPTVDDSLTRKKPKKNSTLGAEVITTLIDGWSGESEDSKFGSEIREQFGFLVQAVTKLGAAAINEYASSGEATRAAASHTRTARAVDNVGEAKGQTAEVIHTTGPGGHYWRRVSAQEQGQEPDRLAYGAYVPVS